MNDAEIINLYWERSESAIKETEIKYNNYLEKISFNILNNISESQECVNDTYLKAWNSMPDNRPSVLSAFLGKIVRNISINKYNQHKASKRGSGEITLILDELQDLISSDENIEDTIERQRISIEISNFLKSLDNVSKTIFIRRYWYCDSISDISKFMSMKESRVKSALFRCRNKLKNYLVGKDIII